MSSAARSEYLAAMGLQAWSLRAGRAPGGAPPASVAAADGQAAADAPVGSDREATDWAQLRERVAACTRCGLAATRTQTVFGVGNFQAQWLVVGEAPGAEEDRAGEPFVGRAGQLLNSMLRAIGLAREQVYIANVLKCRPPHNRDPKAGETIECLPFLERQIALAAAEDHAGRRAHRRAESVAHRGVARAAAETASTRSARRRVPLIVTYHPAYLLRTPGDKRKAWEDLKFAREVFARG